MVAVLVQGLVSMTKVEILHILLGQARANGFEFRKWFQTHIRPEWPG